MQRIHAIREMSKSNAVINAATVNTADVDIDISDKSASPDDERSKTPDSGPNDELDGLSDNGSRKTDSSPRHEDRLVEFVADDFLEKIKERVGVYESSSAFNLAPVDPRVLQNLEHLIHKLCENVAEMNVFLTGQLQQMCHLTAEHVRTYRSGIEKTCDNVDACIKTMYQLMARIEELHKQMRQISLVYDQIRELKRMVTILEGYVDSL